MSASGNSPEAGVEAVEITVPLLFVPKGMDPETVVQWERKVRTAQEGETSAGDLRGATKAPISTVARSDPNGLTIGVPCRSTERHQVVHGSSRQT